MGRSLFTTIPRSVISPLKKSALGVAMWVKDELNGGAHGASVIRAPYISVCERFSDKARVSTTSAILRLKSIISGLRGSKISNPSNVQMDALFPCFCCCCQPCATRVGFYLLGVEVLEFFYVWFNCCHKFSSAAMRSIMVLSALGLNIF